MRKSSNPFMRGTKSDCYGRHASVYHVYPVSRITGEVRAKFIKGGGVENEWGKGGGDPTFARKL